MADDRTPDHQTPDDLTPDQLEAVEKAELLADYAQLAHDHVEVTADEIADRREADQSDLTGYKQYQRWYLWVFLVLIAIVLILFAAFVAVGDGDSDGQTRDAAEESGSESAAETGDSSAGGALTPAELEAQDPIPLAGASWHFFYDDSEERGLYIFEFSEDGTLDTESSPSFVSGTWTEKGSSVQLTLQLSTVATADNGEGDVREEQVDWEVWFDMTRQGNTMRGIRDGEGWMFGYDDGLTQHDAEPWTSVYARPQ